MHLPVRTAFALVALLAALPAPAPAQNEPCEATTIQTRFVLARDARPVAERTIDREPACVGLLLEIDGDPTTSRTLVVQAPASTIARLRREIARIDRRPEAVGPPRRQYQIDTGALARHRVVHLIADGALVLKATDPTAVPSALRPLLERPTALVPALERLHAAGYAALASTPSPAAPQRPDTLHARRH
jgi:hypothetical protein